MIRRTLSVKIPESIPGDPPSEFLLFRRGVNSTSKGEFIFDDEAATSVMADFNAHGVDLPIDLEHQMLDAGSVDPSARDARGWFRLELRDDGSLWAVSVRWTPDGAARLSSKTQRYISPAFLTDSERRIRKVINAALTALPATHNTPALVAASKLGETNMDPKEIEAALAALKEGDTKPAEELLNALLEAGPAAEGEPPADAESMAVATHLSAARTELALERETLRRERAAADYAERVKLCGHMLRAGTELPFTVYDTGGNNRLLPFWQAMPIQDLRQRVERLSRIEKESKLRPGLFANPKAMSSDDIRFNLSDVELRTCERLKLDPKKYAATRAAIRARSTARKDY